jgi:hypothetical protein
MMNKIKDMIRQPDYGGVDIERLYYKKQPEIS